MSSRVAAGSRRAEEEGMGDRGVRKVDGLDKVNTEPSSLSLEAIGKGLCMLSRRAGRLCLEAVLVGWRFLLCCSTSKEDMGNPLFRSFFRLRESGTIVELVVVVAWAVATTTAAFFDSFRWFLALLSTDTRGFPSPSSTVAALMNGVDNRRASSVLLLDGADDKVLLLLPPVLLDAVVLVVVDAVRGVTRLWSPPPPRLLAVLLMEFSAPATNCFLLAVTILARRALAFSVAVLAAESAVPPVLREALLLTKVAAVVEDGIGRSLLLPLLLFMLVVAAVTDAVSVYFMR